MITRKTLRFSGVAVGVLLFAAFTMVVMSMLSTKEVNAEDNCTLSTLKGTYLFQGQGVVIEDGKVVPYAEAGTWDLDGKGNAAGVISGSKGGVPFAAADAFTAAYKLKSGCVYTVVDEFGFELDLYTTRAGKTITYFAPGFSGTQYKQ